MTLSLEIIPGKSIGPFRLGMTIQEIDDALRTLSPETLTLQDLGIMASCHNERGNWKSLEGLDRCDKLEIIVDTNPHNILLLGQSVNGICKERAQELLGSLGSPVIRSYACCEVPERGIEAIRWDSGDDNVYCFWVTPAKTPNLA